MIFFVAHDSPHRGPEISFAKKDPFLSSGVAGGGAKNQVFAEAAGAKQR